MNNLVDTVIDNADYCRSIDEDCSKCNRVNSCLSSLDSLATIYAELLFNERQGKAGREKKQTEHYLI